MIDGRPAGAGLLTEFLFVHRDFAPADHLQPEILQNQFGGEFAEALLLLVLQRQEEHPHREVSVGFQFIVKFLPQDPAEELVGKLGQNARAIARLAVRLGGSPVDHIAAGGDAVLQNPMAPRPMDIGHKSNPAGIAFRLEGVERAFVGNRNRVVVIHVVGRASRPEWRGGVASGKIRGATSFVQKACQSSNASAPQHGLLHPGPAGAAPSGKNGRFSRPHLIPVPKAGH